MSLLITVNQYLLRENTSDNVVSKLYNIAKKKQLEDIDSNTNFIGNIYCNNAYRDYINFITTTFPNLTISANNYYISFVDDEVKNVIITLNNNNDILESEAATMILGANFQNNTNIEYFNEFQYFTNAQKDFNYADTNNPVTKTYSFKNCTNLKEITLSPSTTILTQDAFNNCTSLTTIKNFNNVTKLYSGALKNCNALVDSNGYLDLSNITDLGSECISGIECNYVKFYNGEITFFHEKNAYNGKCSAALNGCQAKYLINLDLSLLTVQGHDNDIQYNTNIGTSFVDLSNLKGRWEFSNITKLFHYTFYNCPYIEEISLPNADYIPNNNLDIRRLFSLTRCKKITIGKVKHLIGGRGWGSAERALFNGNTYLSVVDFGDQIESYIVAQPYKNCDSLKAVIFRVNTPPITCHSSRYDRDIHNNLPTRVEENTTDPPSFSHVNYFYGKTPYIFVPDEAVDTWKNDEVWSFAADKIRPLSEYVESDYITWSTNVVFGKTHHKTFDLENPPENMEDYINS